MSELGPGLERRLQPMRREPVPTAASVARLRTALRGELARHHRPRRIVLAPTSAIAAVAGVVALTSLVWWSAGRLRPATDVSATPMQFVLRATDAQSVSIVGDFNNWDPQATPLAETADGVWSVIVPLQPGTVRFSFLIDGREWRADPNAPPAPLDFGRPTSLAFVPVRGVGP